MDQITQIIDLAIAINKKNKKRGLHQSDVEQFINLWETHKDNPETKSIRVYSCEGFVARAYKWRADICYLNAQRMEDNSWSFTASVTDAKRSHGAGALATINGRAA